MKADEVREFLASFAAAWAAFDAEAVIAHYALPQIVVSGGQTVFLETENEVRASTESKLADFVEAGVNRVTFEVTGIELLPDAAARATGVWHRGGSGTLPDEPVAYTVIEDDDGILAIVAIDADGPDVSAD